MEFQVDLTQPFLHFLFFLLMNRTVPSDFFTHAFTVFACAAGATAILAAATPVTPTKANNFLMAASLADP